MGATLLLVISLGLTVPTNGAAAAAGDRVERQAWTKTGPVPPPAAREGLLYVSAAGGQEQARAFVSLALEGLTVEQVAGSTLVLREDASSLGAETAALSACPLVAPLLGEGQLAQGPEANCDLVEPLVRADDGTWSVPLSRLAQAVTSRSGRGVAVVPDLAASGPTPYSVAFDTNATSLSSPASPPVVAGARMADGDASEARNSAPGTGKADSGAAPLMPLEPDQSGVAGRAPPAAEGAPQLVLDPETAVVPAVQNPHDLTASEPAAPNPSSSRNSVPLVLAVVLVGAAVLLGVNRMAGGTSLLPAGGATGAVARRLPWLLPLGLVGLLDESATYKVGLIGIVFIAAVGLHILVNTAGELSLAHAALLGIPAFVVAQAAARTPLDSLTALPVGVAAGAVIGFLVALTAQRARGLQVALVTLAVAIATVQFLFFQEWLVGPAGGFELSAPSVFGRELVSQSSRVPVLAALVVLAAAAGTGILHSKLGRGLSMVRSDPDVAAAVGIPVSRYRGMAYVIAGAFAGLAGGCYAFWVQIVTPQAFPLQLGFSYLLIAALAGRGGLGGVAVSAVVVQAGVLFDFLPRTFTLYVAPVALILQVTRFEGGINALLRAAGVRIRKAQEPRHAQDAISPNEWSVDMPVPAPRNAPRPPAVRVGFALGCLVAFAGLVSITVAWYNTGRTNQLWIQNQEIVSGGLIGVSLVVLGSTLILRDALLHGRALIGAAGPPAAYGSSANSARTEAELQVPGEPVHVPEARLEPWEDPTRSATSPRVGSVRR